MGFESGNSGRVSQGMYWAMFGAYMIAVPVLLIGGVMALLAGSYGLGLLMIALIAPLGIYWRVIMMRRCRDIGWPAFLPWLIFGLQFAASFGLQGSLVADGPAMAILVIPLVLAFADFVFSIVIGCIGTRQAVDYTEVFGDGPERPRRSQPKGADADPDPDRFVEAIARALGAHRRGESLVGAAPPRPAPARPGRPATGFGRRIV